MAKFLNTSGTNYHLEELIKNASERLILISPYLQLSEKIKELLEDKDRLKIDIRIVYGKGEPKAEEMAWLKKLSFVRIGFCKNLHAKCYMNENDCIITSLNLYEFSQVNNNEMGVLISRNDDNQLFADTYEEVQRIIRISDDVQTTEQKQKTEPKEPKQEKKFDKLTTSKLANKLGIRTAKELEEKLAKIGYLERLEKGYELTELGKQQGGGEEKKGKYGKFYIWNSDLTV
ncbi:MAG: phospholipase D family protein [Moraxellaceae bacterium]|nr:phospholipase D family protein [Moraxellaceae bacterium]